MLSCAFVCALSLVCWFVVYVRVCCCLFVCGGLDGVGGVLLLFCVYVMLC